MKNLFENVLGLFIVIILLYTYYYVSQLSHCPCFVANQEKSLDLNYIKFYIILDMIVGIVALYLLSQKRQLITNDKAPLNALTLFAILLALFIHGYMTYNVYHFYKSIRPYCECSQKWQKYIVYLEGISSGLITLQYVLFILFLLLVLMFY